MDPRKFLDELNKHNIGLIAGVPCSMLGPLIDSISDFVMATNEAEAMGIALGSSLAGKIGVVLMQNSGLGNVVDVITSFANPYKIPCLMVISLRGLPGDAKHHEQMGRITPKILGELDIFYLHTFSSNMIPYLLTCAFKHMQENSLPAALLIRDAFDDIL